MPAGPAVIGRLSHLVTLNHAFVLPTLLCATTAVGADVLRTGPDRTHRSGPASDHTRRTETATCRH
ncbi:hypothetical protein AQI94_03365 [Streptomyces pseudovenezuelae]|uniref:Uncharacterized protein n=1 Tax=Streptomyces pseudovenezuelae TaxID=67350 RepID=A0A101ND80_9ACTN|nr:hypothetical protein AQI94_03365 [Streptomyces pseudovenezuelae]